MAPSKYSKETFADDLVKEFGGEIQGKVVLVTGVSPNGLGAAFAEAIAKGSPKLIILANRSTEKAQAEAEQLRQINSSVETRVLKLDLNSFQSVRAAAAEVLKYPENINVLVNNAGIMGVPYSKTEDGHESTFQTNHLGPFLFTNLIINKILASGPGARVVNVTSEGYRLGHVRYFDYHFHDGESYDPWVAYGASKTASILHTSELARRLGGKGLIALSVHPGVVYTTGLATHGAADKFGDMGALFQKLGDPLGWTMNPPQEPNQGVATYTYAAFGPGVKGKLIPTKTTHLNNPS